jgi:hypothetical protein
MKRFTGVIHRDPSSDGDPLTDAFGHLAEGTSGSQAPPPGDLAGPRVTGPLGPPPPEQPGVDLLRRREELMTRVAELQYDLGGLVYEMAIRDHVRVDVLVRRAAMLQDVDAELGEVERIVRLEESGTAGACASCGAPHSTGAVYCWQCGQPLLERVPGHSIGT